MAEEERRAGMGEIKMIGSLFCALSKILGGCKETQVILIKPAGTIDLNLASSILLDKLEEMGDDKAEIYLPDTDIKVYDKDEVANAYELQEVSSIEYVAEEHDCDDFAAELYGKFASLVWTNAHALCFFISDKEEFYFIEPQTRKLSTALETWQGYEIRFFLMR